MKIDKVDSQDVSAGKSLALAIYPTIRVSDNAQDMLLYLLFPEEFEPITNQSKKREIVAGFGVNISKTDDVDAAIAQLRPSVAERVGRDDFSFLDDDVAELWKIGSQRRFWKIAPGEDAKMWKEFNESGAIVIGWGKTPDLRTIEANSIAELKQSLMPVFKEQKNSAATGAKQLWAFWKEMKPGDIVCAYGSSTVFAWGTITGEYEYDESKPDYRHRRSVEWVPFTARNLKTYSLALQKRLTQLTTIFELTEAEFNEIRGVSVSRIKLLAEATHLPVQDLQEIESLLRDKRQLIFEGPPGAGKTYLADLFARHFTGNSLTGEHNEQIEIVQFHQSYGYEDFVQGIRPVTDGTGNLQYRVVPGIFLQMCDRARKNPAQDFVLIIDEINRGNLSRIFGELLMLLEYREKRVRLPYAPADGADDSGYISIPKNLYLIGTMNSTDRSLAMIDYALRRRFYFYRLMPVEGGSAPVLSRWLNNKSTYSPAERAIVLDYFLSINRAISQKLSPDFQIGHSYFMVDDINTPAGLNRVWQRSLKPLLEEYFHSHRDVESLIAPLAPVSGIVQHISAAASVTVIAQTDSLE